MQRPSLGGTTSRRLGVLIAALSLGGCLFWPQTLERDTSSSGPPDPPSLESRSRAMLEQAVYIPFTEDRNDWVLRRCSQSGEQHRCDLVFLRGLHRHPRPRRSSPLLLWPVGPS